MCGLFRRSLSDLTPAGDNPSDRVERVNEASWQRPCFESNTDTFGFHTLALPFSHAWRYPNFWSVMRVGNINSNTSELLSQTGWPLYIFLRAPSPPPAN